MASIVAFASAVAVAQSIQEYPIPKGTHPHDIAPAADGGVWYTAQHQAALGWLDPKTGKTRHIPLGQDSAPHVVIVGPDGATWITDSGLNAIVRVVPRVDNKPEKVEVFSLPQGTPNINLNTATFDNPGIFIFHSLSTDTELMLFAFRFLRQTMFGEEAIVMKSDAFEKRLPPQEGVGIAAGNHSLELPIPKAALRAAFSRRHKQGQI